MKTKQVEVGRVAFRVEGLFWNAYWAPSQTSMEGAVLLGSIRMSAVEQSGTLKDGFMALMKRTFEAAVSDVTGGNVARWNDPVVAPERERSGRG